MDPQKSANDLRNSIIRIIGTTTLTDPSGGPSSSHHHYPTKLSAFEPQALPPSDIDGGREGAWAWILCIKLGCLLPVLGCFFWMKNHQQKQCQINPPRVQKHPGIQVTSNSPPYKGSSKRKTNGFLAWMGIPICHFIYHDPHWHQCEAWPIVPVGLHRNQGPNESSERRASRRKSLSCSRFCSNEACQNAESHLTFATLECEWRLSWLAALIHVYPCDLIGQTNKHSSLKLIPFQNGYGKHPHPNPTQSYPQKYRFKTALTVMSVLIVTSTLQTQPVQWNMMDD